MSAKNLFQRIIEYAGIAAISLSALACPNKGYEPRTSSHKDEQQSTADSHKDHLEEYLKKQHDTVQKAIEDSLLTESLEGIIYFSGKKDGNWDLYQFQEGRLKQLTRTKGAESWPAISPDKKLVAYSREDNGYEHIFILDLETDEAHQLTFGSPMDSQPAWHPQMENIVFRRNYGGFDADVLQLGGEPPDITILTKNDPMTTDHSPSYSPDGKTIAYISETFTEKDGEITDSEEALWLMNPDGTNKRALTKEIAPRSIPRWNKDGSKLLLEAKQKGRYAMVEVDPKNGAIATLFSASDFLVGTPFISFENPDYSPQEDMIVFEAYTIAKTPEQKISVLGIRNSKGRIGFILYDFGHVRNPVWVPK